MYLGMTMDTTMAHLYPGGSLHRCPRIPAVGALPVEALATPVVEGDITHEAVGVRDQD